MLFNSKFVLASSSLSRYKILKNSGLIFDVVKPRCNEEMYKKKLIYNKVPIKKISLELARLKSKAVSKKNKDRLIVGSDTVIDFCGEILSKANNMKEAKIKIHKLSGSKHNIYSSASVFFNNKEVWKSTQRSVVKIRSLNKGEIELYLKKSGKEILSSVGCYQAEEMGPNIIESIKGDFFNVLGFPLFPFLFFLKKQNNKQVKK